MITQSIPGLTLELAAVEPFAAGAAALVEKASSALGLGSSDSLSLALAVEEVFVYLSAVGAPGRMVRIACRWGGYYVEVEFLFQPEEFDMRAFNLAASPHLADGEAARETGLLIASRMVDRFRFHEDERGLLVVFEKEKTYPEADDSEPALAQPLKKHFLRVPDDTELKELVRLARSYYSPRMLASSFAHPGKVVDMAAAGKYKTLIASDKTGRIGAGVIRTFETSRIVRLYGPYVFDQPHEDAIAEDLVGACVGEASKDGAVGVLSQNPTPQLPGHFFESLGSLTMRTLQNGEIEVPVFYRHLREDTGATVRADPSLHEFLKNDYERLCFAREVLTAQYEGERGSPYSVVSADFDKASGSVILRPVWWGSDAEEALSEDVDILKKEGISNIFFHMDLGKPWQSHFTSAAQHVGFVPRLTLPYCGKGDIVVFQLMPSE